MVGIRYFMERKKLLVLMIFVYGAAFHIFYNHFWKADNSRNDNSRRPMVVGQFLSSIWKFGASSNDTQVAEADSVHYADGLESSGVTPDVHIEHPLLGHTGEIVGGDGHTHHVPAGVTVIAIGGGMTSKSVSGIDESNMASKFQFFTTFLPTFCSTASPGFVYHFYLAYDYTDAVFSNDRLLAAFHRTFVDSIAQLCAVKRINATLHMVQCSHTGKPTWAQNDAMLEAYLDHVDYHYRINDDTKMLTAGWAEEFIAILEKYDPKRVGVVGPNHSGGNTGILTYDFVHRTHVDIFGYYYPRLFTDWWGDDWVTGIYKPDRSTKLTHIHLAHTLGLGQRYATHWEVGKQLAGQLEIDKRTLNRYLAAVKLESSAHTKPDGRKVIAMSLYGREPRYTWGAIRNAQLLPIYLPGWILRIYLAVDPASPELAVPSRIVNKLRLLGAEIARVPPAGPSGNLAPKNWRLLVAGDGHLDYFLIRDADWRPSDREAAAVREWIAAAEKEGPGAAIVHCIRDHPKHAERAIVDGLWGGRPTAIRRRLRRTLSKMPELVSEPAANASADSRRTGAMNLLNSFLWPAVMNATYCHDSVSPCGQFGRPSLRLPFPSGPRRGKEYVGQKYDEHMELANKDSDQVKEDLVCDSTATPALTTPTPTTPTLTALTPMTPTPRIPAPTNLTAVVSAVVATSTTLSTLPLALPVSNLTSSPTIKSDVVVNATALSELPLPVLAKNNLADTIKSTNASLVTSSSKTV